jgi:hypothetical protein
LVGQSVFCRYTIAGCVLVQEDVCCTIASNKTGLH